MANPVTVEWKGLEGMLNNLSTLSFETKDKLAFRAVAAAAKAVQKTAKHNIMDYDLIETGALLDNVVTARQKPEGLTFSYHVGVRHGNRSQIKKGYDPWYWFILEFGSVKYEGRHFMTQAFESEKQNSLDIMRESLDRGITRAVKAQARR
jgi:HK97 gp10 family phage protein